MCIGLKPYRTYSISWIGCFQLPRTLFIMYLRDLRAAEQWVWVCEGWLRMQGKCEISKASIPFHWNLCLVALPFWNKLALLSSAILTPAEFHLVVREGAWVWRTLLRRIILLKLSKNCRIKHTGKSPERCDVKTIRTVSKMSRFPGFLCENEGLMTFIFIILTWRVSHK